MDQVPPEALFEPTPYFNIVLFQPEIPQNTGNIGRTCVALQSKLWIVKPTGFRLDDKQLQRAGLDYWPNLNWQTLDSWECLMPLLSHQRVWYFTKFGETTYTDAKFERGDWLVFGSESSGLPESVRQNNPSRLLKLPMIGPVRSLNLAVSVGIAMYEAYRQTAFDPGS